jgi:ferritin-like metal-binding protein YciE
MAKTKTRAGSGRTSPSKKANGSRSPKKSTRTASAKRSKEALKGSMLEDFFMDALKDIYWAEKALTKALPKMSKSATSQELKKTLNEHLEVTKKQITRLEEVFEQLGKKAQGKKCEAMQGLVEESESIISETKDDTFTRDAALIIAAQKVEHYEIASYGGLVQLAKTMNKTGIAKTLELTLNEEKKADELLTEVAEKSINVEAAAEEGEESEKTGLKETIKNLFS